MARSAKKLYSVNYTVYLELSQETLTLKLYNYELHCYSDGRAKKECKGPQSLRTRPISPISEGACQRDYMFFMIQREKSNLRRGFNHALIN